MNPLSTILAFLTGFFMIATASVLAVGMSGFFKGGDFNRRWGNSLMQARVVFQGLALLSFAAFLLSMGR